MMMRKKIYLNTLPIILLAACSNPSGSTTSSPVSAAASAQRAYQEDLSRLSQDQQIFESFELLGGSSQITQDIPEGGGKLVSGKNKVIAPTYAITQSLSVGEQTELLQNKNLAPELAAPSGTSQTKVLQNGAIILTAKNGARKVSLTNDGKIRTNLMADDQKTVAISYTFSNFESTSLGGAMSNSDDDLLAAFPIEDWMKWGNFNAVQKWDSGSAYFTYSRIYNNDTVYSNDCETSSAKASDPGIAAVNACPSSKSVDQSTQVLAQKVEDVFPFIAGDGTGHVDSSYLLTDGTITTFQGMRAWISTQPEMIDYRIFYEAADGHVYTGSFRKAGTHALTARADGSLEDVEIRLNSKAVNSIQKGLIVGAQGTGDDTGDNLTHKTTDLFGIGGHGVNGSLSAADLRGHYNVPDVLTGAGQTVVIIGGTADGDFEDDLRVYSEANHLPICDSSHANPLNQNADTVSLTPCFQSIHLTTSTVNTKDPGSVAGFEDAGGEIALDLEMAHALAPGANIVLITGDSIIDALQTAANFSEVASISSSFSYDICADQNNVDPNRTCANKDDLPIDQIEKMLQAAQAINGVPIFVASGDAGNFGNPDTNPAYPTVSQYVTAVGGARVHSVAPVSASNADSLWLYAGSGYGVTPMPNFQKTLAGSLKTATSGAGLRTVPDVVAVADSQYSAVEVYHEGQWMLVGGTSVASPVWAGITALIAHAIQINNPYDSTKDPTNFYNFNLSYLVTKTDGGLNGVIYSLGAQNSSSESGFVDIVSGTNDLLGQDLPYMQASAGFDSVSGVGTPDVSKLSASLLGSMKKVMPSAVSPAQPSAELVAK